MGYAPHCNTDVHNRLALGDTSLPIVFGSFIEKEYGHKFEYAERRWPNDDDHPELPHVIYVGDSQARLAKVLKTVAFVWCGNGEIQRWEIKSLKTYETQWIGR